VAFEGRARQGDSPVWTFGDRWTPLAGRHGFEFSFLHRYWLVRDGADGDGWVARTAGYAYQFRERNGDEVVRFEWHPLPGLVPFPHLHVHGHDGRGRLTGRMHIPTGVVTLGAVVRFAIEELGVRPSRSDWAEVLGDSDESHRPPSAT
jgi:hypothetical protein